MQVETASAILRRLIFDINKNSLLTYANPLKSYVGNQAPPLKWAEFPNWDIAEQYPSPPPTHRPISISAQRNHSSRLRTSRNLLDPSDLNFRNSNLSRFIIVAILSSIRRLHLQDQIQSLIMASNSRPKTLTVNLNDLAKMIDHSLLHPTMTDDEVLAGLQISKKYGVATGKLFLHPITQRPSTEGTSLCQTISYPLRQEAIRRHIRARMSRDRFPARKLNFRGESV
jgi:hypothetical protein